MESLKLILPVGTFFQILLLCFILLIMKKNRPANRIFAFILVLFATGNFGTLLRNNEYHIASFIYRAIHLPIISLFGPCIYFYTRDMISHKKNRAVMNIYHFITIIIILITSIVINIQIYKYITLHNLPIDVKPDVMVQNQELSAYFKTIIFFIGYGLISSFLYTIYSWVLLKRYSNKIKEYFSNLQRVSLNWLTFFITIVFLFFLTGNIIFWGHVFDFIKPDGRPHYIFGIVNMLQMLLIFSATYFIITQPDIFKEIDEMEDEIGAANSNTSTPKKGKYEKQSISAKMQKQYLNKLTAYMERNKPYLQDSITLKDLAKILQIPGHHLSIVINTQLQKNFYSFINEYRINEVISILENPQNHDANILSIAFRSGFNSKSAFNNIFKKITGKTPSEYKETFLMQ